MSYVLAIDVGTSFTAAAIATIDHGAQAVPESLPLGLRGTAVPSVVYYPEEGPILVGEAAERRGLDDPGRVVREFKRRIGDSVPFAVGTLALPAEEIFATMARWVVDRAEEREGAPPAETIITHPASWGAHRTSAVLAALANRGLHNVTLITEPEAAALHYASQVRVEDGSTIAVYDLGGGTFDTAILRKAGEGHFEFLGSPGGIEGIGGADFDAAVLRHVTEHTGDAIDALDPEAPGTLAALSRLRRECVEAKEALSADSEASISVFLPGAQQQVRLVRSELEAMIEDHIGATVDALESSLESLGLEPADLTAVLLIGGSSRIPLVAQLISEQLDRPIAVDADPKSSICFGAAVAAVRVRPAVAADPAEAVDAVPGIPAPADVEVEPHDADRRASWSRKSGAAFGSLTGTAAAGDGARGVPAGHAHHDHAHVAKGGAHAPRPAMRLTAVAAGAALFTILTATAAQSPGALSSLTAMLVPDTTPSQAAPTDPVAPVARGLAGAGPAAAAPGAQEPQVGIEASAKPEAPATRSAGIEAAASPTGLPSASAPPSSGSTPAGAAGSTPGGSGTSSDPTLAAVPGTPGTPGTTSPTATATQPPATTDPATTPPATTPPATTDPATTPPVTTPPVTTDPATTPPVTTPPVTTDPATTPPATTPQPSVEPVPTTPVPDPIVTQTVAPAPTTVAPAPIEVAPAPTTVAPAPAPTTTLAPAPITVAPAPTTVAPAPTTVAPAPAPTTTLAPAPSPDPTAVPVA